MGFAAADACRYPNPRKKLEASHGIYTHEEIREA
jgi:hypothetical protein